MSNISYKQNTSAAVVLCGCGHLDGTEIREAVLTLMALEKHKIPYSCFAPNIDFKTVDHIAAQDINEQRNALKEASRITRGNISDLNTINMNEHNALIIPGGFGVAKTLSDIAKGGRSVISQLKKIIQECYQSQKPIVGLCISPAIVAAALEPLGVKPIVTLGQDSNAELITKLGGIYKACSANSFIQDHKNNIITTPAYMLEDITLPELYEALEKIFLLLSNNLSTN